MHALNAWPAPQNGTLMLHQNLQQATLILSLTGNLITLIVLNYRLSQRIRGRI